MADVEPKPRHIVLEAHIVAYVGDYLTVFEEAIKRIAQQEVISKAGESVPGDPKYTASARSRS